MTGWLGAAVFVIERSALPVATLALVLPMFGLVGSGTEDITSAVFVMVDPIGVAGPAIPARGNVAEAPPTGAGWLSRMTPLAPHAGALATPPPRPPRHN